MHEDEHTSGNGSPTVSEPPSRAPLPPPSPPSVHRGATPAPAVIRGWGQNARLGVRDVKRAVLEDVRREAAKRGKITPDDMVEFLEKAAVVFLDENNEEVHFERCIATWEE